MENKAGVSERLHSSRMCCAVSRKLRTLCFYILVYEKSYAGGRNNRALLVVAIKMGKVSASGAAWIVRSGNWLPHREWLCKGRS